MNPSFDVSSSTRLTPYIQKENLTEKSSQDVSFYVAMNEYL